MALEAVVHEATLVQGWCKGVTVTLSTTMSTKKGRPRCYHEYGPLMVVTIVIAGILAQGKGEV